MSRFHTKKQMEVQLKSVGVSVVVISSLVQQNKHNCRFIVRVESQIPIWLLCSEWFSADALSETANSDVIGLTWAGHENKPPQAAFEEAMLLHQFIL